MRQVSERVVDDVKSLIASGHSTREIAARCGISNATVSRLAKKHEIDTQCPANGRPSLLDERMKARIVRYIVRDKLETAVRVKMALFEDYSLDVSVQTVRRALREHGLVAIEKPKKPLLTKRHQRMRMQWAKTHQHWTIDDWKRVVWSDETKINRFGSDGRSWAWKGANEPLTRGHVRQVIKHGGGNLTVWSCISWEGVGYVTEIPGKMDKETYLKILKSDLADTLDYYGLNHSKTVFMQDNDPKHKSKLLMEYLEKQVYEVMEWPPNSPDLNPIENMWNLLKQRLFHGYDAPPKSMDELWERVHKTWYSIDTDAVRRHLETMPARVDAVLKNKGLWIDY